MNNNTPPKLLPEKVVRRHAEFIAELLPDFTRLVMEEGRPADALLNHHLRSHRELGSRDRRFLSQAVFSYFRWYGWTVGKLQLPVSEACLLGVALDSAELVQSFQYMETRCKLPFKVEPLGEKSLEEKRDALNESFKDREGFQPLEIHDLVCSDFGGVVDAAQAERCIAAFQHRPPAWIRSRTDPAKLVQALKTKEVSASTHDQVTAAISVDAGISLAHVLGEQASQFVVQDIASQCVALVCAPKKGGDWWDACAGAGGKSMHLMDLMQFEGKVLATDVRLPALKEVKRRARKHGIKGIRIQPHNAVYDEPFKKTFDGVLVDAPCSGWGTWSRNPDARWRASKRDVIQCATRQLKILTNATWCVKPGGVLVYAVCSLTQPETEGVVARFIEKNPGFKLDAFVNPLTGEPTDGKVQIWPWDAPGDAMFMARFVRDKEA